MSYKGLPELLVARINPVDARAYALASGWNRLDGVNGKVAVFTLPSSDLDQLIIPLDQGAPDYARRMAEVVENLAEKEGRSSVEILNDLLIPPSDVLRFRLDEPESQGGFLPLNQGLDFLSGARRALLAAACSVIQPQKFHPRLSRIEAEQLVGASQLGQTERGSYTVVISCPLDANGVDRRIRTSLPLFGPGLLDEPDTPLSAHVPFTRQVTSLLMDSLSKLASDIDADRSSALLYPSEGETPLSANLCDALLKMQPMGERSRLTLSATWSRSLPPSRETRTPSIVHLRKEYFPVIESLADTLRPTREPQVSYFVGLVDSLFGDPDEQGLVRGEVQLLIFNQEEPIKARVNLDPDDYHTAWKAHGVGGYVSLNGKLVRGDRLNLITEVSNFRFLSE
jgi:hypothetical protein